MIKPLGLATALYALSLTATAEVVTFDISGSFDFVAADNPWGMTVASEISGFATFDAALIQETGFLSLSPFLDPDNFQLEFTIGAFSFTAIDDNDCNEFNFQYCLFPALEFNDGELTGINFAWDAYAEYTPGLPGDLLFQADNGEFEMRLGSFSPWEFETQFSGTFAFSEQLTPVPVPASALLMLSGLIGIGAQAGRRKRKS